MTALPRPAASSAALGAGAGVLGGGLAVLGAETSPLLALGIVGAVAVLALGILRPLLAVYAAVLIIPLETLTFGGNSASTGDFAQNVTYSNQFGQGAGLTPTEFFAVAAAGGMLLRLISSRTIRLHSSLIAPMLLLLLVHLPGLFLAESSFAVVKELGMWSALFLVFVGVLSDSGRETTERLALVIAASGGLLAAIAVAQSAGAQQVATDAGGLVTNRATGTLGQPNLLSLFVVMILPLQIVFMLKGRERWHRVGGFVAASFSLLALALALTRSAFVALAIITVWLVVVWRPFRRLAAVVLLIGTISLASGLNPASSVVNLDVLVKRVLSSGSSNTQTGEKRLELWEESVEMIGDNPVFGVGADNFANAARDYGALGPGGFPYQHAHNLPLTLVAAFGVGGLVVLVWLTIAIGGVLVRALRWAQGFDRALAIGLAGAFLGIATNGMFDYSFSDNALFLTVLLLAALAGRTEAAAREARDSEQRSPDHREAIAKPLPLPA